MGPASSRAAWRRRPAAARNLGAASASGDLARIRDRFESEPDLDALIGSYDDEPAASGFVSQYKNLLQHYVHQNGRREATTFWSGCGAIRREVFLAIGGFAETYARPSVEDIDLGYRLLKSGHRIALDPAVLAKHLKRWRLASLVRSDIFDRALPWTRLILRSAAPERSQPVCFATLQRSARNGGGWFGGSGRRPRRSLAPLAVLPLAAAIALNRRFYFFLASRRGWIFAAGAVLLHLAYYFYSTVAFAAATVAHALDRRRAEQAGMSARVLQALERDSSGA